MIKPKELICTSYFDIKCFAVKKLIDPKTKEPTYKLQRYRIGSININKDGRLKCIPIDGCASTTKAPQYLKPEDLYESKDHAIAVGNAYIEKIKKLKG